MGERNDVYERPTVDRPREKEPEPLVLPLGFVEDRDADGWDRSACRIDGPIGSLAIELVLAFRRGAGFLGIAVDSIAVDVDLVTANATALPRLTDPNDGPPNFRYLAVVSAQATDDELATLHELVRATFVEDVQRATNLRIAGRRATPPTT